MRSLVIFAISVLRSARALIRSREEQAIVELALRQQLAAYAHERPRPRLSPLERVTSDADGNLATDSGNTFRRISRNKNDIEDNQRGIAMAMSLQDPDLVGDERLGLKVGWGTFGGEHAMGVTAAGVVLPDIGAGIRLGVAGGAAFDLEEGDVGGRAGFQLTW